MIAPSLQTRLEVVFRRQRQLRLASSLALCWGALAVLGLAGILLKPPGASLSPLWIFALAVIGTAAGLFVFVRHRRAKPDWHDLARRIEVQYPKLNGLLLTAAQQQPAPDGRLHYLQTRIVSDAVKHSQSNSWAAAIPGPQVAAAQVAHLLALVLFLCVLVASLTPGKPQNVFAGGWTADGVTISPGDTSIERGERLVIVASFAGTIPAKVELVTGGPAALTNRIPLVKSLSDPVFGGSISEVVTDLVYRVEYAGQRTRDFTVKVFEFPRLERADADLTFPDYTGLPPKRVENTRRISAVEGTRCKLTLQLNKPVVRAQLVPKGETGSPLPLVVESNRPTITLTALTLETNRTYLLQLVDADGRTNKLPAQFVLDALKNRDPELKIASPRGDTRPSALEEISFEGTVWDDFGVPAYGLAYTVGGGEIKFVELGQTVPANEKRSFKHLLRLEDLGAQPDQLISWFLWADDIGPDGQLRRLAGDMYFAEVRPFDEVFRQGQGGGGGGEPQQQAGGEAGGSGSPQTKLAELQKQIINATWKLQRQQTRQPPAPPPAKLPQGTGPKGQTSQTGQTRQTGRTVGIVARTAFGQPAPASQLGRTRERLSRLATTNQAASTSQFVEDLGVVREAVAEALSQAQEARDQQAGSPNSVLWDNLIRDLEKAQAALGQAARSPPSLADALAAEQSAFQVLLRLQQREYEVTRNRSRSQSSQSSRNQQMQRQLDQLDLTQPENRYENERLAQSPQSPERREQMQVMNRLAELARRQQDLNERLQELQTALQEAKTEQEREEIRRQLKRLQEEEQRMLADVDELQQRMNQPENQSRMSQERRQLDQTRQDMERTAEAAQKGSASQALASGTRAQRQLQEMREKMRQQNSSAFADDLKQLRAEAREAERQQQEIQKQVDSLSGGGPKTLDDSQARQQTLDQLAQQAQRLTNLVNRATQLSQQTEDAEPLASRELYDALRKFSQDNANSIRRAQDELIERGLLRTELYQRLTWLEKADGVKSVELTSEMLRQGLLPQAQQAGNRVGSAVSDLKRGIERAAEKVLGDDTEALRLAQQQLDQLTEQIEREIAQGQGAGATNGPAQASSAQSQQPQMENEQGGAGQRSTNAQPTAAERPNQAQAISPSEGLIGPIRPISPNRENQAQATPGDSARPQGQPGESPQPGSTASAQNQRPNRGARGGNNDSGRVPAELEQFLNTGWNGAQNGGVITGEDFGPWTDRLREVEEIVEDPALQNQLATARDRARTMRQEYKRTREKPEGTRVRSLVVKPLVEVRNQIADELVRRGFRENLVPIDRDPVPSRFSESVRRYYEELGKDK